MDRSLSTYLLLLIDIQEKLVPKLVGYEQLIDRINTLSELATLLSLPTIVTEQYPKGLGRTVVTTPPDAKYFEKTTFSCLGDKAIHAAVRAAGRKNILIAGIESHICVLQTVKDLVKEGYTPIVLQDALASRAIIDHHSSLQEMRAMHVRVSTLETLAFELVQDAKNPLFKAVSGLIK